jgi:hypothetical protein
MANTLFLAYLYDTDISRSSIGGGSGAVPEGWNNSEQAMID